MRARAGQWVEGRVWVGRRARRQEGGWTGNQVGQWSAGLGERVVGCFFSPPRVWGGVLPEPDK